MKLAMPTQSKNAVCSYQYTHLSSVTEFSVYSYTILYYGAQNEISLHANYSISNWSSPFEPYLLQHYPVLLSVKLS